MFCIFSYHRTLCGPLSCFNLVWTFFGNYSWHVCGPYKYSWCTHRLRCTGLKCGTFSQKTHANTTVNLIWFSPCNEMPTSISYYFFPWTPHILRLLLFQCTSFITLCRYFWLLDSIFRVDFGACFLVVVSHIPKHVFTWYIRMSP